MKTLTTLSLAALASAATVPHLSSRQAGASAGFAALFGGTPKAPISSTVLKPEFDRTAKRELKVWGPYQLQPANGTHGKPGGLKLDPNSDLVGSPLSGICTDCMILSAQGQMAFANGSRQDIQFGVYTHHILLFDVGRPGINLPMKAVCPDGTRSVFGFGGVGGATAVGALGGGAGASGGAASGTTGGHSHHKRQFPSISALVGNGEDASALVFASTDPAVKSGFYAGKDDRYILTVEAINYDDYLKDVWFSLDIEYIEGPRPAGYLDVGGGAINIDGCEGGLAFHPPADKPVNYTSNDFIVDGEGYILNWTPHLHDGGLSIEVFLNKELVCHSDAVYGAGEGTTQVGGEEWTTITAYTPCDKVIKVKKGDILHMTAQYDLTKHRLRPDSNDHHMGAEAMALATFMYARTNGTETPPVSTGAMGRGTSGHS